MSTAPVTEAAQILCMDIVGYSKMSTDRQTRVVQILQQIVGSTAECRQADRSNDVVRLPAGDGMGLVFFKDVEAPARCAVEITEALRRHAPGFELRMGIHAGPVVRGVDINGVPNVNGDGVNVGFRVMDCANGGQVLLSDSAAAMLGQLSRWSGLLMDHGDHVVRHGRTLHLYEMKHAVAEAGRGPATDVSSPAAGRTMRIALLYKRGGDPDEHVLALLEKHLIERGHVLFIDRHIAIGLRWAREIEAQIHRADAVIALLSRNSVTSEMLAMEVQIALEAFRDRGKPLLLPLRLVDEDPLPEALAPLLDPIQYALWRGPEDDARLLSALDRGLALNGFNAAPPLTAGATPSDAVPVGGLAPGSPNYIERATDAAFLSALERQESIILVQGARQVGKTSLFARGLDRARKRDAKVAITDFQKFTEAQLASSTTVFKAMAESLAKQLRLDPPRADAWSADAPSTVIEDYLADRVLQSFECPLVWALDEVDRLFTKECASEVFGVIRSWHNNRAYFPDTPWQRLSLPIAYATEAHLFITDLNQSPFNVGTKLDLRDFSPDQVRELNERRGRPLRDADLAQFHALVGGHPYLAHRGFYEIAAQGLSIDAFASMATREDGVFGDHLRRMLMLLIRDEKQASAEARPSLADSLRKLVRGQACDTDAFYRLRGGGIVIGENARTANIRCRIYATYLERHLLNDEPAEVL